MTRKSLFHAINYVIIDKLADIHGLVELPYSPKRWNCKPDESIFCRAIQVHKYVLYLYRYKKVPEFLVLGKQFLQGPVYSNQKQNLLSFEWLYQPLYLATDFNTWLNHGFELIILERSILFTRVFIGNSYPGTLFQFLTDVLLAAVYAGARDFSVMWMG